MHNERVKRPALHKRVTKSLHCGGLRVFYSFVIQPYIKTEHIQKLLSSFCFCHKCFNKFSVMYYP